MRKGKCLSRTLSGAAVAALFALVAAPVGQAAPLPIPCDPALAPDVSFACTAGEPVFGPVGVGCSTILTDGSGFECGLIGFDCAQVLWGIHAEEVVLGGNNGCHAKAWTFVDSPCGTYHGGGIAYAVVCVVDTPDHPLLEKLGIDPDARPIGVGCGFTSIGVGAFCGLLGFDCFQALWGYHSDELVIGGYNGCSGGVWVRGSWVATQ